MNFGEFNDTKEKKEPNQEDLNEARDKEFDEKVKRRALLSINEKQALLKEAKERTFSRGLPEGSTKEEAEIKSELRKKEQSELQPEAKAESDKVNDTSEDLDKELDEELHKYFSQKKEERKNKLKKEIDALDADRLDEILDKLDALAGDRNSEDVESLKKPEVAKENKSQKEKEQLRIDSIAERKNALEEVIKLGKSADIDVSDAISDIQKEIEELEKQAN